MKDTASRAMNIVFSCDENYAPFLATTMVSILLNASPADSFNFYIIDCGLSSRSKNKINALKKYKAFSLKYIEYDTQAIKDFPLTAGYSMAVYLKYFIAELIPDAERLLYLDVDLIITSSLAELYNTPLNEHIIGAVQQTEGCILRTCRGDIYVFNSGVLLVDAKSWRETDLAKKLVQRTAEIAEQIIYVDQDVFNSFFEDNYEHLDEKWNTPHCTLKEEDADNVKIIHYLADKFSTQYSLYLFLYLSYTGFDSFGTDNPKEKICAKLYKSMLAEQTSAESQK